jgi:uncharacterized membrane protein
MDDAPQGSPLDPASKPAWRGLSDAGLKYAEARCVLLQIEAQEAVQTVSKAFVSGVLAAVLALGGWLLLVPAALWWLCQHKGWPLEKTFIIAGFVHIVLAVVLIRAMMSGLARARWFAETLDQFKRDRAWIAQQTGKP